MVGMLVSLSQHHDIWLLHFRDFFSGLDKIEALQEHPTNVAIAQCCRSIVEMCSVGEQKDKAID